MSDTDGAPFANRFLSALQASGRKHLRSFMEPVSFECGSTLSRIGERVTHGYFLESGMISLVKTMQNGQTVDMGAIGREGIAPLAAVLDLDRAIFDSVVQIGGTALRISRLDFQNLSACDANVGRMVRAYGRVAMAQLTQTAACNGLHAVEKRCCRWLLTAHDNAGSDTFALTHEHLGLMLGVRHATVSLAAEHLQRAGLIKYVRGKIVVKNRRGLELAACECYAATRAELDGLFSGAAA